MYLYNRFLLLDFIYELKLASEDCNVLCELNGQGLVQETQ